MGNAILGSRMVNIDIPADQPQEDISLYHAISADDLIGDYTTVTFTCTFVTPEDYMIALDMRDRTLYSFTPSGTRRSYLTLTGSSNFVGASLSKNGRYLAIGLGSSSTAYCHVISVSSTGTLNNITDLGVYGQPNFSDDGQYLAVSGLTTGRFYLYKRSGTTFNDYDIARYTGDCYKATFAEDNNFLYIINENGLTAYKNIVNNNNFERINLYKMIIATSGYKYSCSLFTVIIDGESYVFAGGITSGSSAKSAIWKINTGTGELTEYFNLHDGITDTSRIFNGSISYNQKYLTINNNTTGGFKLYRISNDFQTYTNLMEFSDVTAMRLVGLSNNYIATNKNIYQIISKPTKRLNSFKLGS